MKESKIVIGWKKTDNCASMTGRRLLQQLLEQEYEIFLSEKENPIEREAGGKPFLVHHRDVYFNISHSGSYVACAVGKVPLGIDIQYHKKGDYHRTGRRIMTPDEWEEYERSDFSDTVFFRCWTKKESYLKYTGEGIRRDMRTLDYDTCCFHELKLWEDYSVMLCVPDTWKGKIEIYPSPF